MSIYHDNERIDPRKLRTALGQYATGVAVMTTRAPNGKLEGVTANSFASVSLEPPLVLWSLRRAAPSLNGFLEANMFVVNVLSREQSYLSRHFGQPRTDKFADVRFSPGFGDCPVLEDVLSTFECSTETTVEGGDHVILIGRVRRFSYREGQPLIFSAGRYGTHNHLGESAHSA
jgi:flavin reductase (DIM6/NTAB) family NADH-FMN oxidoreductase RutF